MAAFGRIVGGRAVRRLIDRAMSNPNVRWRSVGEVVSDAATPLLMAVTYVRLSGVFQPAPTISTDATRRALEAIAHRGRMRRTSGAEDGVFLGHRRLSIIDLATGGQPMHSADGRYVVIFNGRSTTTVELRRGAARDGGGFSTSSDTEVILEGYRRWGAGVVERLHGMFASWSGTGSSAGLRRPRSSGHQAAVLEHAAWRAALWRRRSRRSALGRRRANRSDGGPRFDGVRLHSSAAHHAQAGAQARTGKPVRMALGRSRAAN